MRVPLKITSGNGWFFSLLLLLLTGFAFTGCKKETREEETLRKIREEDEKNIQAYLEHHNLKGSAIRTSSGLYYVIETPNLDGEQAVVGKSITVDYIGRYINGATFESSFANGRPFTFTLGKGDVIPGWDEGIALMKKGEKFKLIIPSGLAYGITGRGNIPPNAILIFDTWLRDVR